MDIKAQIESIAEKIRKDKSLQAEFKKDPVKAVEKMLGRWYDMVWMEKIIGAHESGQAPVSRYSS